MTHCRVVQWHKHCRVVLMTQTLSGRTNDTNIVGSYPWHKHCRVRLMTQTLSGRTNDTLSGCTMTQTLSGHTNDTNIVGSYKWHKHCRVALMTHCRVVPMTQTLSGRANDTNIDTLVIAMLGTWHYRVSARTGRPGVSTQWVGDL